MAHVLMICNRCDRDCRQPGHAPEILRAVMPVDIAVDTTIDCSTGVTIGTADPVQCMKIHPGCVCLGLLLEPCENWYKVASGKPEGAFALFRSDESAIELISDALGQRTIWYAHTETLFLASSSQRAIVQVLGGFCPSTDVYPWMLATGTLGPLISWDRRIRMVPPNSIVKLDRRTWEVNVDREVLPFLQSTESAQQLERRYRETLQDTFSRISLDCSRLMLPLSGGYDSRAILMMLRDRSKLRSFTIAPLDANKYNTRSIASRLADYYQLPIQFFERDNSDEPAEAVMERFVIASEGRIDGVTGYQDGFKLFRDLRDEGVEALLWGDECYGWKQFDTIEEAKSRLGLHQSLTTRISLLWRVWGSRTFSGPKN